MEKKRCVGDVKSEPKKECVEFHACGGGRRARGLRIQKALSCRALLTCGEAKGLMQIRAQKMHQPSAGGGFGCQRALLFCARGIAILFFATALANCQNAERERERKTRKHARRRPLCMQIAHCDPRCSCNYVLQFLWMHVTQRGRRVGLLIFADFMPRL